MSRPLTFYEFFAGAGMARAGLGEGWTCLYANDFDPLKAETYRANWGGADFVEGDVFDLDPAALPGRADLAWASSPCQDFSLAGARAGLDGGRSSALFGFLRAMKALADEGRAPRALVVENVCGLLTSRGGGDFAALCAALADLGYDFGALQVDAALFAPQSRPRLFVVAARSGLAPETPPAPRCPFSGGAVAKAFAALPDELKARWRWWSPPLPARRNLALADVLEPDAAVAWRSPAQTRRLLELTAPLHRARIEALRAAGGRHVGAAFRRTRVEDGRRVQRAEARFDGLAGCLRTAKGGSSRQLILVVEDGEVRSRFLTGREAARLMGLPDDFRLPRAATAALHVAGDGVAPPVVRHLARTLLEPLLSPSGKIAAAE